MAYLLGYSTTGSTYIHLKTDTYVFNVSSSKNGEFPIVHSVHLPYTHP